MSRHDDEVEYLLEQILRACRAQTTCLQTQAAQLATMNISLEEIAALLEEIESDLDQLVPRPAVSATLTITSEGDPEMPATIHVNGNGAQATFTEFDLPGGTGNKVPPIGPVVFTSSDTTIATVDSTGKCAAVAAGLATITGFDQGNGLTASDSLTVTADVAVSATLTLQAL